MTQGSEEVHHQVFDNSYFAHLDSHFGPNMSRDVFANKVDLVLLTDSSSVTRLLPSLVENVEAAIFDSHSQRVREGQELNYHWYAKNDLLLQLVDQIVQSKNIKKKLFLNYPFNIYQTRKEDATPDILTAISHIKSREPAEFKKKVQSIHKEFKVNLTVMYNSLFQVYLRESYASEFFFIEVPYLIPGVEIFPGLYLPQMNILDDLIIFMRDGMVNDVKTPINSNIPIIPIDLCCSLLLKNLSNNSALLNNFYSCLLKWKDFFYIVSDHFTIHSPSYAYAGPEVKAEEKDYRTKVS